MCAKNLFFGTGLTVHQANLLFWFITMDILLSGLHQIVKLTFVKLNSFSQDEQQSLEG